MTQEEINKKQDLLKTFYKMVREEVGGSTMDTIYNIVELELELEKQANK